MATTVCQSNSRATQSVKEPMKTQWLQVMTLAFCFESVLGSVLKNGSNHYSNLFTDALQDNVISSKATECNMMPYVQQNKRQQDYEIWRRARKG